MKQFLKCAALCSFLLSALTEQIQAIDYLFVYKDGVIRHRELAADVDSIAMEKEKSVVTLYDVKKNVLYTSPRSEVDSISFQTNVPQADLLDICFLDDGTAVDISPMKMKVKTVGKSHSVYYSDTYKRNLVSFSNPWGGSASGYYKIDYESNTKFRNALANGHSLECIVMANYSGTIQNCEAKWFSSHQAGGTGFLISTISGNRQNEMTFLPNVSTSGSSTWRWATSGIVPVPQVYYHLVGVWDKQKQKAYIYVNGVLKNTVDAQGSLVFPQSGNGWFCIGGDPSGSDNASPSWSGNVVLARVYDDALSAKEVSLLWEQVHILQSHALPDMVTNVGFLNGFPVKNGGVFSLTGTGFEEGDELSLTEVKTGDSYLVTITTTKDGCSFVVPEEMESGTYRMVLLRGERKQTLGTVVLTIGSTTQPGMRVIAHRGYWDTAGSSQNSCTSLRKAFEEQCYGSECDVWITTDGYVMCNHDPSLGGVTIQNSTYATCKNVSLSNGEKMPELKDFLDLLAEEDSTKLIIEIKTHSDEKRGRACCDSVVNMVRARNLQDKVEYIGFSAALCRRIVEDDPEAHVAYLNGDLSPMTLYNDGIMGLDYTAANYRNHPTWVGEAHALGMTTNVWTIDDKETMIEMSNMGIDFVTTNNPVLAKQVYAYYSANYSPDEEEEGWVKKDSAYADLLDIRFNADGTVEDLSPMKNIVEIISDDARTVPVEYNEEYKAYAGHFQNVWGGAPETYCKVDYTTNYAFQAALADGHTIETVFCPTFEGTLKDCEAKWFSSHQSGGTGFLISKKSGTRGNEITFLPNVSPTGGSTWRWATSGVTPESGKYYHVVGVWNKEEQKAYVYVNGELKNTVKAQGSLVFPSNGSTWFGIGCDPSGTKGEASGDWRIVKARIYDKALTPEEVEKLW